jgi:hypothetical protein
MHKPSSESRHLYTGGRLGSKQVSPKLILGLTSEPSFDLTRLWFRRLINGSLALVSLSHTCHGLSRDFS